MANNSNLFWNQKARAQNDCAGSAFRDLDKIDITLMRGLGSMQKIEKDLFGRAVPSDLKLEPVNQRAAAK